MFRTVAVSSSRLAVSQSVVSSRVAGAAAAPASCGLLTSVSSSPFGGEQRREMSGGKIDRFHTNLGRTGLLAMKCGMMGHWDSWGKRHPLTVLKVEDCRVVQVKTMDADGYSALQIGGGQKKAKNTTKPLMGHFQKAGLDTPLRFLHEFRCNPDNALPIGYQMSALHFAPGQYVDCTSISAGKGFQGVMKRWGFKGQGASHGATKSHRSAGSTGQHQDPGRIWKGKKMAGRMGGKQITQQSMLVFRVDPEKNLIFIRGSVAGKKGTYVRVKDAIMAQTRRFIADKIPVPTWDPSNPNPPEEEWNAPSLHEKDPYHPDQILSRC